MFERKFGIEIEFTGITRTRAAGVAHEYLGGRMQSSNSVKTQDGRVWKFVSDSSITAQRKNGCRVVNADSNHRVELVSPILKYRTDIELLQGLVRALRKAGAFANRSCGIHIHLNGADHNPRSIRNFVNIIASKNDLFYKALQIEPNRMRYCKKIDQRLVEEMNRQKPYTLQQIEDIWYARHCRDREAQTRYNFLNLHSLFTGHRTVELRGFNSTLHAGKIRSYIVLALALNNQALTQKSASSRKPQVENEKFAMRVYLNRIGFIGDEFKNCREHLCCHLSGNSAWRYRVGA